MAKSNLKNLNSNFIFNYPNTLYNFSLAYSFFFHCYFFYKLIFSIFTKFLLNTYQNEKINFFKKINTFIFTTTQTLLTNEQVELDQLLSTDLNLVNINNKLCLIFFISISERKNHIEIKTNVEIDELVFFYYFLFKKSSKVKFKNFFPMFNINIFSLTIITKNFFFNKILFKRFCFKKHIVFLYYFLNNI